jgi:hypothetical protein
LGFVLAVLSFRDAWHTSFTPGCCLSFADAKHSKAVAMKGSEKEEKEKEEGVKEEALCKLLLQ